MGTRSHVQAVCAVNCARETSPNARLGSLVLVFPESIFLEMGSLGQREVIFLGLLSFRKAVSRGNHRPPENREPGRVAQLSGVSPLCKLLTAGTFGAVKLNHFCV